MNHFVHLNRESRHNCALIVIDMVEDFFDASIWPASGIPKNRNLLITRTNNLVAICRKAALPVIWVRQEFRADLKDAFLHMRRQRKSYTIAGTPGCDFLPELDVRPSDLKIIKQRFSAFFRTGLHTSLTGMEVKTIIISGITAEWCVRTTAVDAYQRDLDVILAADCISAFTESEYTNSMAAMSGLIAEVLSNDEIACRIGTRAESECSS